METGLTNCMKTFHDSKSMYTLPAHRIHETISPSIAIESINEETEKGSFYWYYWLVEL